MSRPYLARPLGLLLTGSLVTGVALAADLREVDQRILEYSPQKAREALAATQAPDADRLVAEGRILGLEKKYDEAEAKLMQAAAAQGGDPAPWAYLGENRQRAGKEGPAREAYQKSADLARQRVASGASGQAVFLLGRALQGLGSFDEAAANLAKAEQQGVPAATLQLGITRAQQERWAEANDILSRALQQNSGLAYAYYYRGLASSKLGKKAQMINDLDRFVALAPNAPEADTARRIIQSARR